jgi:ubiquinone/menaquinone biosynthesis C-methylase UbiE
MNQRHSKLTDWGLKQVSVGKQDTILDVGCGGGRTIRKLAAIATAGKIHGIDHSETSVAVSERTNWKSIDNGLVEIHHGSVSHLPFPDQMFDLATAVETHYYWPDLPADMREVLRVLKPGGMMIIIAEAYKGGKYDARLQTFVDAMRSGGYTYAHLNVDEHRELLSTIGFSEVQVFEDYDKGWICAVGRKPSAA